MDRIIFHEHNKDEWLNAGLKNPKDIKLKIYSQSIAGPQYLYNEDNLNGKNIIYSAIRTNKIHHSINTYTLQCRIFKCPNTFIKTLKIYKDSERYYMRNRQ